MEANRKAFEKLITAEPILIGCGKVGDILPDFPKNRILHSGPDLEFDQMRGPHRKGIVGAALFENLAQDEREAEEMIRSGEIEAAAASPALLAERSESLWDGIAQESEMARICYDVNPRFKIPSCPGVFAPAGILADRAADSGITPKMHGGILSKVSGGQIGVGYAHTPLACFEKAAGNV